MLENTPVKRIQQMQNFRQKQKIGKNHEENVHVTSEYTNQTRKRNPPLNSH